MCKAQSVRICYHNIWGWSVVEKAGSIAPRCRLIKELEREYLPDVICLQEFLSDWRLAENDSILFSLAEFQYAEADVGTVEEITPHHKNICPTATPILYRKNRLKLLRCGVHKFDIYNGGGADKFATWAIFETPEEKKKFGVMSIHLAYQWGEEGDRYRLMQAEKVMELIRQLEQEEGCPVIFGGDLNSLPTSASYRFFADSEGIKDIRSIAAQADDSATHGPGPLWNEASGTYSPRTEQLDGDYLNGAYDHVFCAGEGLRFESFRVIHTPLTRSISDHVPLLIDFS